MNRVGVSADGVPLPPWNASLKKFARTVLARLGRDKWDLSVLLCGDSTMTALNSRYRGREEATDVLSFMQGETACPAPLRLAGDIAISLDTLRENARRFRVSEDEELRRLLIHGILHLDGMDHRSNRKTEPMLQLQERIMAELAEERIMGRNG